MEFRYSDWFPPEPNVGYETLIYDVMIGDATLFKRADMVEATWRVVQPVLDAWEVTSRGTSRTTRPAPTARPRRTRSFGTTRRTAPGARCCRRTAGSMAEGGRA